MDTFDHVKKTIVDAAKDAGETLADVAKSARDAVVEAKDAVFDAAKGARDTVYDAAKDAKDTVYDAAKDAKDSVFDAANDAKEKTLDVAEDAKGMAAKVADSVTSAVYGAPGDILTLLKTDHELVNGYFEQIEATTRASRAMREGLFGQLKYELETHALAEEKLFYTALRKGGSSSLLTEAGTDHDLVKELLSDLANQPVDTEAWLAQLRVLKENVQRHVQMEEDELFSIAKDYLTGEYREELGTRFLSEKKRLDNKGETRTDRGARGSQASRTSRKSVAKKSSRSHHGYSAHR